MTPAYVFRKEGFQILPISSPFCLNWLVYKALFCWSILVGLFKVEVRRKETPGSAKRCGQVPGHCPGAGTDPALLLLGQKTELAAPKGTGFPLQGLHLPVILKPASKKL